MTVFVCITDIKWLDIDLSFCIDVLFVWLDLVDIDTDTVGDRLEDTSWFIRERDVFVFEECRSESFFFITHFDL